MRSKHWWDLEGDLVARRGDRAAWARKSRGFRDVDRCDSGWLGAPGLAGGVAAEVAPENAVLVKSILHGERLCLFRWEKICFVPKNYLFPTKYW